MTRERPAATVTVYPDGPLVVRGDVEVRNLDGEPIIGHRTIALCRCGRSGAKPLCDGSHRRAAQHARRKAGNARKAAGS